MAEEDEDILKSLGDNTPEENILKDEEEVKATKFQSPVPFLRQLRNLVFGKRIPDMYTQLTFYMNSVIWTTFMVWNVISYFTLSSREFIRQNKGINIEQIVGRRGSDLGYEGTEFIDRLTTFHAISIICWGIIFVGLILLFRKSRRYIYFVLGPLTFYIGMSIFYIGWGYFAQDMTSYDKIALLIVVVSTLVHSYLMGGERSGRNVGFFGEPREFTS